MVVIITLIADRAAGYLLKNAYAQSRSGSSGGKLNYFLEHSHEYNIVILGNSRAHRQVDPREFPQKAFNLGHSGMDLVFQVGVLSELARQKSLPPVVLLHIDARFFITGRGEERALRDAGYLKQLYGENPLITEYLDRTSKYSRVKNLLWCYRFNGKVLPIVKSVLRPEQVSNLGYEPLVSSPQDAKRVEEQLENREEPRFANSISSAEAELLETAIRICKENGSRLVCFTGPTLYFDYDLKPAKDYLDKTLSAAGVPYIDFQREPIKELQDHSKWRDLTHLNYDGAIILSRELSKRLDSVLIGNESAKS